VCPEAIASIAFAIEALLNVIREWTIEVVRNPDLSQAQKRVRLAALAATDDGVDTHVVEQMLTADVMLPLVAG
jgi:hypothetical protein